MNAAAVPKYVNEAAGGFEGCPPGHRFNLYFPVWSAAGWQLDKNGKANALRQTLKLGSASDLLNALCHRQKGLAEVLPEDQCFIMEARSTAPFATGLGLEHPIENGFAFLTPYGLPYLSGSGVKGVLRQSAEELHGVGNEIVNVLFGHEDANNARRGALACWDVLPVPPKDELVIEIMTPHFGDYYQGKSAPHDAGKPNPIPFLAVPARSKFCFIVTCDPRLLTTAVPYAAWKGLIGEIITHAFHWLGFGAKTAVGYGAMQEDPQASALREKRQRENEEKIQQQRKDEEKRQALSNMSLSQRTIQEFLDNRADKNQPELSALVAGLKKGEWSGELKIEIADHVKARMQEAKKWKEKSEKKNPEKDSDYQNTLLVKGWLNGK